MSSAQPVEIERLGDAALRIVWDDGHESTFANAELRFRCSCAMCVDELTGVRRLQRAHIPADIRANALELVGNYAIQITWSDGHATGIYTFERLRYFCPCPLCTRARSDSGD